MLDGVVSFYADTENGTYLPDPGPGDLLSLVTALNTSDNTFVVLYPTEPTNEWYISVATSRGPFGGYEIERHDPATSEKTSITAAVPGQIVTDVLTWVADR